MRRYGLIFIATLCPYEVASAQTRTDVTLALASDDLFRGQSQSGGRAVGRGTVGIDLPGGVYGGLSASMILPIDYSATVSGLEQYVGYAKRLGPRRTLDVGIVHASYYDYAGNTGWRGYAAIQAGLIGPVVAVRASLSPNYFAAHRTALYGEVNATPFRLKQWDVTLHGGLMATTKTGGAVRDPRYAPGADWRLGIARRLGRIRLEGALAGATAAGSATRTLLTVGTSF